MQTSLKKMMSAPTVDTSYSMSIDELDAYPMISVCPKLSPDIGYLFAAWNYIDVEYFLSGIYDLSTVTDCCFGHCLFCKFLS